MPIRTLLALSAGLLLSLVPAASVDAYAQNDSAQVQRFRLADAYLRAGQFEEAVPLLEDLHAERPEAYTFYDKLKEAYESIKRYDDAIALVEQRMEIQGQNPGLTAEKARLLYQKGDESAALETWEAAVALAPEHQTTYHVVNQSLIDARLFSEAIAVMEQGRAALDDPTLFQVEMAYLYSLTGRHADAITQYLAMLAADSERLPFVQRRLAAFLDQEEALEASIAAARQAVQEEPLNRAFRELAAWLHMEADQYGEALRAYRAIDRLEDEDGRALFHFAQQAAAGGAYDAALEAYSLILEHHPDAPVAPEAQRGLGLIYEKWAEATGERASGAAEEDVEAPHYEAALAAYRAFLEAYPNHAAYPDVLRRVGRLQQDVFVDLDAAERTLREVAQSYPETQAANEAAYDLGRIAVMRGALDEARLRFSRLADRLGTGELAERARYELALLHIYQGEFDAALTLAEAINANTSTDVANDGIGLKVLILTNKGPDSTHTPLRRYAEARLLQRQHRPDEALRVLDSLLAGYGRHTLADDARHLRAVLLREQGRSEDALAAFAEIPMMYPQSPLADQSLFAAAELQEQALNNKKAALETYNRLLEMYPGSLLASEVRSRIRTLWEDDTP